jgi:uncharacterized membrane protein
LASARRQTGGDAVPLVLGGLLLVALVGGGAVHHLAGREQWMDVNVALAVAPVVLATVLFSVRRRGLLWWLGTGLLVLLLPNTPYVLTDVVHLPASLAAVRGAGASGATVTATYLALFCVGIIGYTYVLALIVVDLRCRLRDRLIRPVLLSVNAACAVGVWLGRGPRLNSWDAAYPWRVMKALVGVADPRAGAAILLVFVVVGVTSLALLRLTDSAARRLGPRWLGRGEQPLVRH